MRDRVRAAGYDTCVAVNDHRVVFGLLRSDQLEGDPDRTIEEAMRPGPSTFRPHVGISELVELMQDHNLPNVPITTGEGLLVGLLTLERAREALEEVHGEHEH